MTTPTKDQLERLSKFPISIGVRIALTEEQKQAVREAYDRKVAEVAPAPSPSNGRVTVQTNFSSGSALVEAMGLDRFTLISLLSSSERYTLPQLKKWERALGLTLVTKKQLDDAWKGLLKTFEF